MVANRTVDDAAAFSDSWKVLWMYAYEGFIVGMLAYLCIEKIETDRIDRRGVVRTRSEDMMYMCKCVYVWAYIHMCTCIVIGLP